MDHVAKWLTADDARAGLCSVCGGRVEGGRAQLRHLGEAAPQVVVPARADMQAVRRAELIAERALQGMGWAPSATDSDRAEQVVAALYAAGLLAQRPRSVRARRVKACAVRPEQLVGALFDTDLL